MPDVLSAHAGLADQVAAVVSGVVGVARLHAGPLAGAATYLPGRRVDGVSLTPELAEVHVVLTWDAPAQLTADRVRAAVRALVHTPVDVVVEDVDAPGPVAGAH